MTRPTLGIVALTILSAGCMTIAATHRSSPVKFPAAAVAFERTWNFRQTILYRASVGAPPFPPVILAHTCGGNGDYTFDWAKRLTDVGYAALIVDSNSPRGTLNNCNAEGRVTADDMVLDVAAAIAHLRGIPDVRTDRVGVLGFSFGGGAVLRIGSAAYRGRLGADVSAVRVIASLYPPCNNPHPSPVVQRSWENLYDDITIPTMVFLGALDTETIPGFCITPIDRLRAKGQPIGYKLYPATTHGYDMWGMGRDGRIRPGGHLYRYSEAATEDTWREMKALFDRELGPTQ